MKEQVTEQRRSSRWYSGELWSPRLTALLIGSIVLLGAISLLASRSLVALHAGNSWVVHSERVRFEIGHVMQLLTDVETGMRGYVLTSDRQFLEPYRAALPLLPPALSNLRQLIADNPTQRSNAAELESREQASIAYAQGVVRQIVGGDSAGARSLIASGEGKRRMDAARAAAAQMQAEETRLLELRRVGSDEALRNAQFALGVTDALAVLLLLIIAYSAVRYAARLRIGEKTLATTLRSIGDAVISTDAGGAVQFMNAVAERLTGWDARLARGRGLDEVFHILNEQTRVPVESPATKVLRKGKIVGPANHTVLIGRDGTERLIEDSGAPIFDGDTLAGAVLVFRDTTTQRAAQNALLKSEKRFRAAVGAVQGIVWTNNAAGEMEEEQPGWAALTGQSYGDYRGFGWAKAVHPNDAQSTIEAWNAAVAAKRPFVFEHRVKRQDGEWRTFSVRAIAALTETGDIGEWVGVHTDITDAKAADTQRAQLAAIAEQSNDFIGLSDAALQPFFLNAAGRELIGLPDLQAVRTTPLIDCFTPDSRQIVNETVLPAVQENGFWSGELDFRHFVTGATIPVFYTLFGIRGGTNSLVGFGTVTRDLTESKSAERALRASEARLNAIFETVPVGIVIGEAPSGKIIGGNPQVEAILGHPIIFSPTVESYSAWVAHHADGRRVESHEYPLARAIAGEERPELEVCYQRGDGRMSWVRFIGAPIYADGQITGAIVASLDIDRERRALQALERIREELEARVQAEIQARETAQATLAHAQRLEALGQLAGGIAHDFNNVLQSVAGGLNLIQKRAQNPDDVIRFARMASDAAGRGASVTARLLAFARKGELRAVPVPVFPLLENIREILASTLGDGISLKIDADPDVPALKADKAQLETVMINLAVNARDAMPAGGTLILSARPEVISSAVARANSLGVGGYVRLDLIDTGIGMDEATLARASEPFFTTKGPSQGTGLGLAMARGFALQSGGGLAIRSALGQGTTVTLWFPQTKASAGDRTSAETSVVAPIAPAALVLVVDDDTLVRQLLTLELQELGYRTLEAADGLAALAILDRGEPIDLLVTDFSMPGMNGLVLTQEARQRRPLLPVLLLTGYADANVKLDVESMQDEALVLLRKPVSGDELGQQANALLRRENNLP